MTSTAGLASKASPAEACRCNETTGPLQHSTHFELTSASAAVLYQSSGQGYALTLIRCDCIDLSYIPPSRMLIDGLRRLMAIDVENL
ncbi:hypothetical protein C8Q80DRAFT_815500 [Daedaleopsis nitida]|nr:hypothetical protein C8Q80DRAFT_815500 [Daedaleopsis nitida]